MKRIFGIFCLAALVFCACDNDKDNGKNDGPFTINPYDLVGVWACTDHIDPSGEHAPNVASCTSMIVSIKDLTHYAPYYGSDNHKFEYESMKIDGDRLILDEGKETEMVIKVKDLDGKHLTWLQYPDSDDPIQESYINVTRIIPGKWKVNYPDGSTTATIEANGSLVEEYQTEEPFSLNCEWLLYISNGQVVLKINELVKDYIPWETEFIFLKVNDNRIEAKQSGTNAAIVLERQ